MTITFDNSYSRLPEQFHARTDPTPVANPTFIGMNDGLARRLGLDLDWLRGPEGLAMMSGNRVPDGAAPLAQAYAGHQFGGFVPQLGDGRAVLLGEVIAPDGARFDIQLKGAGPTPFSRRGDGRAWVGPVIREYIVSEAMAALGVPTTRALAAVRTGEDILRDMRHRPGAVLTRVAASHIRVGTFQFFAARGDSSSVDLLCNHLIERHYPDCTTPLDLLRAIVRAQAELIAAWMSFGFIHGVMNTDNMAVSGETIDYGPCAFMDGYHPQTTFSSIDRNGRYAYGAQPQMAVWNLAQLATSLVPLMGDQDSAIEQATEAVNGFVDHYQAAWLRRFGAKIGLSHPTIDDVPLIQELLNIMAADQADFTRVFSGLRRNTESAWAEFTSVGPFEDWLDKWHERLRDAANPQAIMASANPLRIPRNHQVEAAIVAAEAKDYAPFDRLNAALHAPYSETDDFADMELAPRSDERVMRTFCGT
ncbi:hypothetical protein BFP70_12660 [Thioclava sp. SK-1]|uniref:protein adenylyltransferase SelO n=1 Tax=Thioclava sp. SK-1 TaxID=1889770 RepID=UPI0008257B7D|nr:YdiU family protein [Thioclava sp. SK-1]OCX63062.1 hypothetical protein BFP70_12660 [Thioclava sp. SK-1]